MKKKIATSKRGWLQKNNKKDKNQKTTKLVNEYKRKEKKKTKKPRINITEKKVKLDLTLLFNSTGLGIGSFENEDSIVHKLEI